MNYIKKENEKAYTFLTAQGYELVKASKLTYTDEYYDIVKSGWLDSSQVDNHPCYDEYVSLIAISHIFIVKNWKGDSKSFHNYLKDNNLLLPKYYHLFDKFEKDMQYVISDELKEAILEALPERIRMGLYYAKVLVYEHDDNVRICILRKNKTSTKFIAEGLDFNKIYSEGIDIFTLIQRGTLVLHPKK